MRMRGPRYKAFAAERRVRVASSIAISLLALFFSLLVHRPPPSSYLLLLCPLALCCGEGMTFAKWKSYSYKPLETSRHKRRHTVGGVRAASANNSSSEATSSYEDQQQGSLSLSGSLTRSGRRRDEELAGVTSHGSAERRKGPYLGLGSSGDHDGDPTSSATIHRERRTARRSLSVSSWTLLGGLTLRRRPSGSRQLRSSVSPSREEAVSPTDVEESSGQASYPVERKVENEEELESSDSGRSITEMTHAEAELDAALEDAWSSVMTAGQVSYTSGFLRRKQALEYSRKMAELRTQYQLKMAEIHQREATFAREFLSHDESTPLLRADQLTAPAELKRAIRDTRISGRFDKLRLELKRDTAVLVTALRARYPSLQARLRTLETVKDRPRSRHWPVDSSLIYCNNEAVQSSGSMVGIYNGLYATESNTSTHSGLNFSGSDRSSFRSSLVA